MTTKEHIDYLCPIIGLNLKTLHKKKSWSLTGLYHAEKNILKANNFLTEGNQEIAEYVLKDVYSDVVEAMRSDKDYIFNKTDKFVETIGYKKEIDARVKQWCTTGYVNFLNQYNFDNLFKVDELTAEVLPPQVFIEAAEAKQKGLINAYHFGGKLRKEIPHEFTLKDHIVIVNSLEQFLTTIPVKDKVIVYLIMKLEERIDLSYFLLIITYQGSVWLATDQTEFGNPRNKRTTRNAQRWREEYMDYLAFPYYLIDKVIEERIKSENTGVAKTNSKLEFLKQPIRELHPVCRMFIVYITSQYILDIAKINKPIGLLGVHTDGIKLLGKIDPTAPNKEFEWWHGDIMTVQNELVAEVTRLKGKSTSLILNPKQLAIAHKDFDRDWLAPPEKLTNIIKWSALDSNMNSLQGSLNNKFSRDADKQAFTEFSKLCNRPSNRKRLESLLFSANELYFDLVAYNYSFSPEPTRTKQWFTKAVKMNTELSWVDINLFLDVDKLKAAQNKINKSWWRLKTKERKAILAQPCSCCKKNTAKPQIKIHIRHYKQLVWLAGVKDNSKLPDYLRIYRAHNYVPYTGNSILDNVHPMTLLEHPSWRAYVNGIDAVVWLCNKCMRRLNAEHKKFDDGLVKEDGNIVKTVIKKTTYNSTRI